MPVCDSRHCSKTKLLYYIRSCLHSPVELGIWRIEA